MNTTAHQAHRSGYAFGQGGSVGDNGGGGGGGLYGGYAIHSQSGSGGSGYIGGVAEFSYKGVTYTPSTTNGGNAVGAHGSATITLVEKAIVAYIGDTPIITMYLGDKEIEDISELW